MSGVNEGLGAGEKCGSKKANMKDLCSDRNVLYIDCGDVFLGVYICENSLNCILCMDEYHNI